MTPFGKIKAGGINGSSPSQRKKVPSHHQVNRTSVRSSGFASPAEEILEERDRVIEAFAF